jgi:predicted ATPase/DNA-binding NarL/FixJ family response regulator
MQSHTDSPTNASHSRTQVISFVGREAEISNILRMLEKPDCRLITLIGPGGMGKTRLALRIAELATDQFADGCHWIDLQPLQFEDFLPQTIIDVLGLDFSADPLAQLSSYLQHKQLLLIFDNFEHLLDDAPVLTHLLAVAPNLKILVTSREALNLREEWVHHLDGLPYPATNAVETAESYPAVELFVQLARRTSSRFDFAAEQQAVVQICRQVAGMPLALELAAAWTRSLSCAEIAREIQNGLALLTARTRNMPDRHRSIRAVFEQTCAMLSAEEFAAFKRLSVFRGGFQREAAEAITGATLPILSTLIDKSLVKLDAAGRYHMHELIAQYADDQLPISSTEARDTTQQHSAYYANLLQELECDLYEGQQKDAVAVVRLELENIRTVWQRAVDEADSAAIQAMAPALAQFGLLQSRDLEMSTLFGSAIESLRSIDESEETKSAIASLLVFQTSPLLHLGKTELAEHNIQESMLLYRQLGADQLPEHCVHPKVLLCFFETFSGNHELALAIGEDAQHVSETLEHTYSLQWACCALALAALSNDMVERALDTAQRARDLTTAQQNAHFQMEINTVLGNIALAQHDHEAAKRYIHTSIQFADSLGTPGNKAASLNFMGIVALQLSNYTEALDYFEESQSICRQLYNQGRVLMALQGCARAKMRLNQHESAWTDLREALEIGIELQFIPRAISILVDFADLFLLKSQMQDAIHLLQSVADNPAMLPETVSRFNELVSRYHLEGLLSEASSPESLETLMASLPQVYPDESMDDVSTPTILPKFQQPLVEPLTEREQEVLHYIVEGLSNRAIAETLVVSISTVKSHINSLYGKLGVSARDGAIQRAQDLNLL